MAKWDWIEKPESPATWGFALRVIIKAGIMLALCNTVYAIFAPIEALGGVSLYNTLLPGRERLPYGENFEQSYSLSLNNIPAMFASHVISRPKGEGEFRVVLIGDSGVWGWFLANEDTLAGQLNDPHPRQLPIAWRGDFKAARAHGGSTGTGKRGGVNLTPQPPLQCIGEGEQERPQGIKLPVIICNHAIVWRYHGGAPLQVAEFSPLSTSEAKWGGDGVKTYNLAYPIMSLTKDLLLLDEAMRHQPDMIVWLVTLESFPREKQLFPPLAQHNAARVRNLINAHDLQLDPADARLIEPNFFERTVFGQRRDLADWLRLQLYGFSWAATGIDQYIPDEIPLRQSDFEADESWQDFDAPVTLTRDDLAVEVLAAGVERAGDVPVLIVNEPIFISSGANSDLRYNSWYPRWAYDQYRALLAQEARANGWQYLDLWDSINPAEFTDSPVHLTATGTRALAELIRAAVLP